MREILFRGKTISGDWVEGNYSHVKQPLSKAIDAGHYIGNSAGVPFAYRVIPSTIGMFTGLHDRDGKRIFEGDIIETDGRFSFSNYDSESGAKRVVFWHDSGFTGVRVGEGGDFDRAHFSSAHNWNNYQLYNIHPSLTIIGNIHES